MDHMNHMNHMNHGGGLRGHDASGGGGMGHSMKGMPVAFEWGHRVTLFFDGWATETSFDYVLALFGLFLLCVAQEQLYHFRTSLRMSRQEEQPGDLSAPIVPKPFSVPSVRQRAVGTVLYGLNLASSYLIMLAVMTCNGGIFLTVVFAMMFGHFLGPSRRPVAAGRGSSEACHPED